MVTKGSTRTQTTAAAPATQETLQAACQAHTLAQMVYERLASEHAYPVHPMGTMGYGMGSNPWSPGWEGMISSPPYPTPFPYTYYPR